MKYTLDTNIFLHGLLEDPPCELVLAEYTRSQESFIIRKVYEELVKKRAEWNFILRILSKKWDNTKKITESFEEIKNLIGDKDGTMTSCQNLINYLEIKRLEGNLDINREIVRLNSYLGGYIANKKPIHPSEEMFVKYRIEEAEIKKIINVHNLVDGEQDKRIIREIYIVTRFFSDSITLVTKNIKDFHTTEEEWKKTLSQIIIVHPNSLKKYA